MLTRSAGAALPNPARAGFFTGFGCAALVLSCLAAPSGSAATWVVGAAAPLATLAEAVRQARDGDTILVRPGEYRGDVALIQQKRLTIRGIGQRAVFIADGRNVEGKAMRVVREISGQARINVLGFCVGGTLLGTASAVLAARACRTATAATRGCWAM